MTPRLGDTPQGALWSPLPPRPGQSAFAVPLAGLQPKPAGAQGREAPRVEPPGRGVDALFPGGTGVAGNLLRKARLALRLT